MGMVKLLFSFQGRINRTQYWAGSTLIFIVFILVMIMAALPSLSSPSMPKIESAPAIKPELGYSLLALALFFPVSCWCTFALHVKRLHDRGRSGYLALLFLLPVVSLISLFIGLGTTNFAVMGFGLVVGVMNFFISLYLMVDLGMLPGVDGPNKHGPPPGGGFSSAQGESPAAPNFSLDNAQTAMERAIAARSQAPAAAQTVVARPAQTRPSPAPAAKPAPALAHAAAQPTPTAPRASFGRKTAR